MEALKSEERTWAALTHILGLAGGIVPFGHVFGPLIMWQLKKEESKFVDQNGKSALNFQISYTIYFMILAIIFFLLFFSNVTSIANEEMSNSSLPISLLLFFGVFAILATLHLVLMIIATIKSSKGEFFKYPLSIQFIK